LRMSSIDHDCDMKHRKRDTEQKMQWKMFPPILALQSKKF